MLLNTNTGQIQTYSEDNPQNKNTINMPKWFSRAYTQGPGQTPTAPTVNIYAGPGQSTHDMMNESMWLVQTGSPLVASVSASQ